MSQLFNNPLRLLELLYALGMTDEKDQNNQFNGFETEALLKEGYFPLRTFTSKFGYSKDHIGRLARTGRIQAVRHGNKGDWFVHEASLERYHREAPGRFVLSPRRNVESSALPIVSPIPSEPYNRGSSIYQSRLGGKEIGTVLFNDGSLN